MKKQTKIKKIANLLKIKKLLNAYFEWRYKKEIQTFNKILLDYETTYKTAFRKYRQFIKLVPPRADVAIFFRGFVVMKLRVQRVRKKLSL